MIDIQKRGDLWWPKHDYHCFQAVQVEVNNVHPMVSYCKGLRRCAVQAGGNVGVFPLELIKYFDLVISFEPDPENYVCLSSNTSHNPAIKTYQMGLGDQEEMVGMEREIDNCGAYYVKGTGPIKIMDLDSFDLSDCDFLQLDIEGYEYKALQGAWETIKRCRPVIVCEEKGLGTKYGLERDAIGSLLQGIDYKVAERIANDVIYTP